MAYPQVLQVLQVSHETVNLMVWFLPVPMLGMVCLGTGMVSENLTCRLPMRNPKGYMQRQEALQIMGPWWLESAADVGLPIPGMTAGPELGGGVYADKNAMPGWGGGIEIVSVEPGVSTCGDMPTGGPRGMKPGGRTGEMIGGKHLKNTFSPSTLRGYSWCRWQWRASVVSMTRLVDGRERISCVFST